jgi:arginyl-tRNA synthetase
MHQHVTHTIIGRLQDLLFQSAKSAFPEIDAAVDITQSTQSAFGHYQYNSAMKLGKQLKKNPREIANAILAAYNDKFRDDSVIKKMEIAGPGFINITLTESYLENEVERLLRLPHLGVTAPRKEKIVIDFSSPNTAKEMHVGHLRSTIIGDSLARAFEFLGHDVLRLNHIGDWGTSFGMLIAYIKGFAPNALPTATLVDLMHFYKEAKKLFDADAGFKKSSQLEVVALQSGQKEALDIWSKICDISRTAYQEIYDLLDIHLNERGESFYNPMLEEVVLDLEKRGLVSLSEGAKCIFLEGFQNREAEPLPLMIQKSDGGYHYDTTDMAAIRHRVEKERQIASSS